MTIKDHTYYQNFLSETELNIRQIDYHIRQAERYKRLYELTKNVRGYGWLNWIARRLNTHHFKRGSELAHKNLADCLSEIECLTKFLNNKEDLA